MAIKLMDRKYNACVDGYTCEFLCDTDADLETLPDSCVGSTAVSIESGKVMVVNTEGKWVEFGVPAEESIVGTWQFNSTLTSGCPSRFNVTFTTNNNVTYTAYSDDGALKETNSFVGMFTPYSTILYFVVNGNDSGEAIGFSGFSNAFDGVIHITGGDDINNETFITWLKANATKVG